LAKAFCRCLEAKRLSGTFVQPPCDGIKLTLGNIRQVHALWEVLSQQAVGISFDPRWHGCCGSQK